MAKMFWSYVCVLPFLLHSLAPISVSAEENWGFPPVNLPYATQHVMDVKTTKSGLSVGLYRNIRYARPPLEERRFKKPVTPPTRDDIVQYREESEGPLVRRD
ncbi:hypothetical protein ACJ72_06968 [Emergomyces africanus]|uniref:Uncharacterized protein n=1 Tax=Emergomyces africanus TaxID=1955775 RepID=A0A1B7NPI2_9EURO|nr:hypothetical protein ACJ72_06968 [Emergomyces africanus]